MNRDTVVASTIGFSMGLVAAIMLWVVPRILPKNAPKPTPPQVAEDTQPGDKTETAPKEGFSVSSPADGEIVTTETVKVNGIAPGASYVTITTPAQSLVTQPDAEGKFSASLTVSEGVNQIVVMSLTPAKQETKTISVYQYGEVI